jgi:hypothetical protein
MRSMGWFAALSQAMVGVAVLAQAPQPIDVSKLGPQPGARVPDFSLKDQSGATRTLASLLGPKGAMLVFFRSADW